MKTYLAFIVSTLISLQITAQYTPLLQDNNTWKCQNFGLIFMTYQFSVGEEVTEGEFVYKQLIYQSANGEPIVYTLLREDILEQRVYIFQPNGDAILYDFSLEVNDVATVYGLGGMHEVTVTDVTTTTVNGTSRKKITFTNDGPGGVWIEGIGSLFGVPDAALGLVTDYSPSVTCFYEGNTLAWDNPDVDGVDCSLTLGVEQLQEIKFNIYPNPATDYLWIMTSVNNDLRLKDIKIYDIAGQLVLSQSGIQNEILIDSLTPGMYVIDLTTDKLSKVSSKFIKTP